MNETGRGIAVGLGFCAGAALVCADGFGWIHALTLVWIVVLTLALSGSMMPKKDKTKVTPP